MNIKIESNKSIGARILHLAKIHAAEMIRLRRHLHQYPETAMEEFQTQKTMAPMLKKAGCQVNTKIWKTAIVGILEGKHNGKTIGIRSDMDALPVIEQTGFSFASKANGKMHACGHDAHMSIVWGAARILSELKDELNGSIKFVYQPSEERHPGGAKALIDHGVLKNPQVSAMLGLHVYPTVPAGKIGIIDGVMMAEADEFTITVIGRSGHAARPHETVDSIVVAANIVTALQNIASRQVSPFDPVVITIGQINGGTAHNIITGEVVLKGTARTLSPNLTKAIPKMLEKFIAGVCETFGAKYIFDFTRGYPPLVNSKNINDIYRRSARGLYGSKSIIEVTEPAMGGEDFAFYAQKVPSAMLQLGVRNPAIGADRPWHHSEFKLDEMAIPFGAALMAYSALMALRE